MIDNLFSIKEASKMLECSTQNLYQMKGKLIAEGFMEKSNSGRYLLNEQGINFLRDKRILTLKTNKGFNQLDNKDLTSIANANTSNDNTEIIEILKQQLQEIKNDREYWKNQAEKREAELQEKNNYIQELNTKAFSLLGTAEQNHKQEENVKKGFWGKIFGK